MSSACTGVAIIYSKIPVTEGEEGIDPFEEIEENKEQLEEIDDC